MSTPSEPRIWTGEPPLGRMAEKRPFNRTVDRKEHRAVQLCGEAVLNRRLFLARDAARAIFAATTAGRNAYEMSGGGRFRRHERAIAWKHQ
jgi:hypothetical protein